MPIMAVYRNLSLFSMTPTFHLSASQLLSTFHGIRAMTFSLPFKWEYRCSASVKDIYLFLFVCLVGFFFCCCSLLWRCFHRFIAHKQHSHLMCIAVVIPIAFIITIDHSSAMFGRRISIFIEILIFFYGFTLLSAYLKKKRKSTELDTKLKWCWWWCRWCSSNFLWKQSRR